MQKDSILVKCQRLLIAKRQYAFSSRCRLEISVKMAMIVVTFLSLSACVTENYRAGVRQTDAETEVNADQAASVRVSLGLRYLQKGDFSQAKYNLSKALELDSRSAEANYAFAYFLQKTGEAAQADSYYRVAIELAPNNGDTRNNYGVFLCEQQKYAEAQAQFLHATQLTDYIRSASTYENLALCAQAQHKVSEALAYLTLASQHQANPSKVIALQAELQYQSGQFDEALMSLEQWFSLQKPTADMLLLKHLAALASHQIPLAYQAAQALLASYPTSVQATWYKNDELYRCRFEQMRSEFLRSKSER